jgi:hypothetical protein
VLHPALLVEGGDPRSPQQQHDIARVDEVVVSSLIRNKVTVLVREKISWAGDVEALESMPKLQEWIHSHFHKADEFGIYEVWVMDQTAP